MYKYLTFCINVCICGAADAESDTEEGSLVIDEGSAAKTKQPQGAQVKKAAVKRKMVVATPEPPEVSNFH